MNKTLKFKPSSTPSAPDRPMTREEAFERIKELLGDINVLWYRDRQQPSSPALRKQAARRRARIRMQMRPLEAEHALASAAMRAYCYELFAFEDEDNRRHLIARGDTWEDVLEQLRAYLAARADAPAAGIRLAATGQKFQQPDGVSGEGA